MFDLYEGLLFFFNLRYYIIKVISTILLKKYSIYRNKLKKAVTIRSITSKQIVLYIYFSDWNNC